jgi:hypothetical protein
MLGDAVLSLSENLWWAQRVNGGGKGGSGGIQASMEGVGGGGMDLTKVWGVKS